MVGTQSAIVLAARAFEAVGVAVLVVGALIAFGSFVLDLVRGAGRDAAYSDLRGTLGRGILLGLEFLVAADIIRSVAVSPSLQSVVVLGIIVLIRTFLSWSLEVEITGQWPWQRHRARTSEGEPPARSEP